MSRRLRPRLTAALLAVLAGTASAQPATVTGVDLLVDTAFDNQPYDAASLASCTDGMLDGDCTLREAIAVANVSGTLDRIGFEITTAHGANPATGIALITLQGSQLPTLTDVGIGIDGTTQPGWVAATATVPAQLKVQIDGGSIGRSSGVILNGSGQALRGLSITRFAFGALIGAAPSAVVEGCHIGVGAAGTGTSGGITEAAVRVEASGVRVGSNGDGIGDAAEGNRITNSFLGVQIVASARNVTVLGNAIFGNQRLGIDLEGGTSNAAGVSLNDFGDVDNGANGVQNYPVIRSVTPASVAFTLSSKATSTYRVELFASTAADPTGYGEGQRYLGFTNVTTNAAGDAAGSLVPSGLVGGEFVTATATGSEGTSEFSLTVRLAAVTVGSGEGYYLLAAPGTYETVGSFLGPVRTQCFAGADYDGAACANGTASDRSNVFFYTEATAGGAEAGYAEPSSAAMEFAPGVGAAVYLFADDDYDGTADPFPKGLPLAGGEPALPFSFSLTYHDTGDAADGLNLLGNPRRSALDWNAVWDAGTRANVSPTAYIQNPSTGFSSFNAQTNTGTGAFADGTIPAGYGFFVRATADGPVLVAPAGSSEARVAEAVAPHVEVRVSAQAEDGAQVSGGALVAFAEGAAFGPDELDAASVAPLGAPAVWVAAVEPGAPLRAQAILPVGPAEVDLAVGLAGVSSAAEVSWRLALPDGWTATLVDRQSGMETAMTDGGTLSLDLAGSDIVDGQPTAGRFAVRFTTAAATAADPGVAEATVSLARPNPTASRSVVRIAVPTAERVRVTVYDALGRAVAVALDAVVASAAEVAIEAGRLAPGVYVVRVVGASFAEARSLTVIR